MNAVLVELAVGVAGQGGAARPMGRMAMRTTTPTPSLGHRRRGNRGATLLIILDRGKTFKRLLLRDIGAFGPYPLVAFLSPSGYAVPRDPLIEELDDSADQLRIGFEIHLVGHLDPFFEEGYDLLSDG